METTNCDGKFKVRQGSHNEQVIQVPRTASGEYWRYVDKDGTIWFVPAGRS